MISTWSARSKVKIKAEQKEIKRAKNRLAIQPRVWWWRLLAILSETATGIYDCWYHVARSYVAKQALSVIPPTPIIASYGACRLSWLANKHDLVRSHFAMSKFSKKVVFEAPLFLHCGFCSPNLSQYLKYIVLSYGFSTAALTQNQCQISQLAFKGWGLKQWYQAVHLWFLGL